MVGVGVNLNNLLAAENDSLLTVKRKARVFKDLMKEPIPKDVKTQMKEYVNYLDKKNLVKNRKWAFEVVKHLLVNEDEAEIPQTDP